MLSNKKFIVCFVLLIFAIQLSAAEKDLLNPDPVSMQQFEDKRFGMFIHWGPVSLTGHEIGWSRGRETPIEEYDKLYKKFEPTEFNAEQWVKIAKEAGMKYMVFTTKHHDGFCMWDTKHNDYNIMNTPFGRDVVKELSEACKKHGLAFGAYYSVCDWHHPDFPRTGKGGRVRRQEYDLDRYTEYLKAQVKELIENYGPFITLWYDVPQEFDKERGREIIRYTRALQTDIIINSRTGARGDYYTPEQRIGGFNRSRAWETCMTICNQWAWKPDDKMKSFKHCIQALLQAAGGDGNLLFNVGPTPDGRIEPRQVARLKEMGDWLEKYGDAVYGTRGGPFKPGEWGASTCKNNKIYLFVMQWPKAGSIQIPALPTKIKDIAVRTGGSVSISQGREMIEINVPVNDRDPVVTVIELTVDGKAFEIEPMDLISVSEAYGKKAEASNVFQNNKLYNAGKALDGNSETRWATDSGTESAWLEVDLGKEKMIGRAIIDEGNWDRVRKFRLEYKDDSEWKTAYSGTKIGSEKGITFDPVKARFFRLNILDAVNGPTIQEFNLFEPGKKSSKNNVQRYGSVIGVKENMLEKYKKLHANPWPEVNKKIKECNIQNYSIFLTQFPNGKYYLFSYFEYTGDNFEQDMAKMAADPITQKWWKETDPCQFGLENRPEGQWWKTMEEVYHLD